MHRALFQDLIAWKHDARRKPLILMGARQVGKTYILKQFASDTFAHSIYLNFEDEPRLRKLFTPSLDPQRILQALEIEFDTSISPEKTLIIFDEIQECPEALNSLKYFNEKANEYCICAAGSLLGVKLYHVQGFPVGQVDFLHLYPLNFFEFLQALDEERLCDYLQSLNGTEPIAENLHAKLLEYFKIYLCVGGMPEAVLVYSESKDFSAVRAVQKAILHAYQLDFSKHAPKGQIMKINQVSQSIPSQLTKENHKFIYSVIRQGARAQEFETAIQWLAEAGIVNKVNHISIPNLPLSAYEDFKRFKLYFLDVGLMVAMSDLPIKAILHEDKLFREFKGIVTETYVAQALATQYKIYYWTSKGKAELDFVFQCDDLVIPLEVKSGFTDKKKSLQIYAEKYQPKLMLRSSPKNFRKDGNLLNCPLYLLNMLPKFCQL